MKTLLRAPALAPFLIWLALIVTGMCSAIARAEAPLPASERVVVMVSIDGLAAFYLDDPEAKIPTIRALAAEGVSAPMQASAPSITWPNHTNLVTGVTSAVHGVVGNEYYDRTLGRNVALLTDFDFDKEQIVRVPTIYDIAKAAGLTTAAVRWPATRKADALDWTVPEVASAELQRETTTPALLAECLAAGIWDDGVVIRAAGQDRKFMTDETGLKIFKHILVKHRPNLSLLHLIDSDKYQHAHGPQTPEAYAAIELADRRLGEIRKLLDDEFAGRATLIVVSDHGFSRIKQMIAPNVALRNLGLVKLTDDETVAEDSAVKIVTAGGAALVYVLDEANRAAILDRVRKFFTGTTGIDKIVGPGQLAEHGVAEPSQEPRAPDMILFAGDGYGFSDKATGDSVLVDEPTKKGTHGHDEHMPILYATFVAGGAGIAPAGRLPLIKNIDIAPTIAELLGLKLDRAVGKPVQAALAK